MTEVTQNTFLQATIDSSVADYKDDARGRARIRYISTGGLPRNHRDLPSGKRRRRVGEQKETDSAASRCAGR